MVVVVVMLGRKGSVSLGLGSGDETLMCGVVEAEGTLIAARGSFLTDEIEGFRFLHKTDKLL